MYLQTKSKGITFTVHDVETVRSPMETRKTRDLLKRLLREFDPADPPEILYLSGYNSNALTDTSSLHPLISAVHIAFSQHRPLALSPDMIWIAILQGFSQHVRNNSEELRHLLVTHEGKEQLAIYRKETFVDSPEYDWEGVIHDFANELSQRVGDTYTKFVSDFSTTGPLERVVSEVTLLDVFQSYFEYILYCSCGIPTITLEGSPDDWLRLREKVELLQPYKLDWWLPHVREILDQFHRAANGDVDRSFWQDIYKDKSAYAQTIVNGWIVKLIPYVRNGITGDFIERNPVLSEEPTLWEEENQNRFGAQSGIGTDSLPSGIAQVPFLINRSDTGKTKRMQFLAGFIGAEQEEDTQTIRPILGWAVREAPGSCAYLNNLPSTITRHPAQPAAQLKQVVDSLMEDDRHRFVSIEITGDFFTFYKECDGLSFQSENHSWKVRSVLDVEKISANPLSQPDNPPLPLKSNARKELPLENRFVFIYNKVDRLLEKIGLKKSPYEEIIPLDCCSNWLRFLDEDNGSYLALALGDEYQVYRIDPNSGTEEKAYDSFESAIRDYIARASAALD